MSPGKFQRSAYQVCVKILKARHLPQNANPMVVVKVGNRRKKTVVRERTDSPVYNEYLVFDLLCDHDELLSTKIMIAVYLKSYLRFKFHGSTSFEVALVWDQPDRQYYHKWAMLMNPKDLSAGPKGYVKCNIAVNVKGEKMKVQPDTEGEDDIEGNLLLPVTGEFLPFRQRACYVFTIYRADGLPDMSSVCVKNHFENINPIVQISFAGMKGSTSQAWQTYGPKYNEKITFREMFPSLCQRVRIAIKHRIDSCRTCVVASCILNMSKISNSGENGFLPTFGPSFLHFYGPGSAEKSSCFGKCSTALPLYRGRVLLSLKTEMDHSETTSRISVETEAAAPIVERSLWRTEEYYLVAVIYDASMIDRRKYWTKSISFEISLGNAGNGQFGRSQCFEDANGNQMPDRGLDFESETAARLTGTLDGEYNYVPLGSRKPCLCVRSRWPNLEWRMHNSNSLAFVADFLAERLDKLERMAAVEDPDAYKFYNETIRTTRSHCIRYLHTLDAGRYDDEGGTTKLDRHRVNLCREELESILQRIKINGELPSNHYTRIAITHAYQYLRRVRKLREDPQHGLPDVFIWMMAGSKRVAFERLAAGKIVYSDEATERGPLCGRKVDVFLRNPKDEQEADYVACKLEMFLWLGNAQCIDACWSSIPRGYRMDREGRVDSFPKYLEYTRSSAFQLRAHVFQGRFDPGMDASGLLDPIVRVAFHGYTACTRVIKQTLDPFWDQTLILPARTVHGAKEYIKLNPPKVILQVYDLDVCGGKEFCGRCAATPLVKLAEETYSPPDFPPKLEWYKFKSQRDCSGSVLAAFELIEIMDDESVDRPIDPSTQDIIYNIPEDIRPKMTSYRLEVIFWGVRDMRKINYVPVLNPRIVVECAGVDVKSEVMENAKKFSNYKQPHVLVDLDMPELDIYYPSVVIKAYDSRGFGCFKYAGVCIVPTVYAFLEQLITEEDYNAQIYGARSMLRTPWTKRQPRVILPLPIDHDPSKEDENEELIPYRKMSGKTSRILKILESVKKFLARFLPGKRREGEKKVDRQPVYEDEPLDWWWKYFASVEEERGREAGSFSTSDQGTRSTFKVYNGELEMQPEFAGFQDRLRTFELWKGRKSEDSGYDTDNYVGKFKGSICAYRWPHPSNLPCKTRTGRDAANGLCGDYPNSEPVKLLVRLYVVKGINLQPNDPLSGKSDPYLCIRLGKTYINDKKNYIPNQLNPTFGRLFEMDASFPQDYSMTIQVWDYDATSADDLIGETRIDLENRFYSRHRATCGISRRYQAEGYDRWRDRETPTRILEQLCKKNNLPSPEYGDDYVKIGRKRFPFADERVKPEGAERMALDVLHQWQDFPICGCALVPEHLERRPLFNAVRPGLEQGKLELWIDMFQLDELPPKPPVDISPPVPEEYEIRVVVWNTEAVPLVDSQFLTGEKCSDIYVKGWILYNDYQKTDVHYNSLTGEGNFNWRFVFRVIYSKGERVMIVRRKVSVFARSETEDKLPCILHLQVWDSDHVSADDFLGALTLDLSKMPRGSPNSKSCTLKLLDPSLPTIDLFKVTRIKAWWPFERSLNAGQRVQAGKVELEMSILPAAEANEQPVGRGRDPPQNLPPPNRPDTSFSWFRNPWKAFRFVVCRHYKWRIICCLALVLLVLLVGCAIYAFPGYLVKRILGA